LLFFVICVSAKKKRPVKKAKGKDDEDASASDDEAHDPSNVEKVTHDSKLVVCN